MAPIEMLWMHGMMDNERVPKQVTGIMEGVRK
jgi:hypothetical protein